MTRRSLATGLAAPLAALITALLIGAVGALPARATIFDVDIDTTGLAGFDGRVVLDFTGLRADNLVTILSFTHDGTTGLPETLGGLISGDLLLGINPAFSTFIDDDSFHNRLSLPFEPFGTSITFTVQVSEVAPGTGSFTEDFFQICGESNSLLPGKDVCVRSSNGVDHTFSFSLWSPGGGGDPGAIYDRDAMTVTLDSGNGYIDFVEGGAYVERAFGSGPLTSSFGILNVGVQDFTFQCGDCAALAGVAPVPDEFSILFQSPDAQPLFGTADPLAAHSIASLGIDGTPEGVLQVFAPASYSAPLVSLTTPTLDSIALSGVAVGGSVSVTVSGEVIVVTTTAGQTTFEVVAALAAAIHIDTALTAALVRAHSVDGEFIVSALISDITVLDPGLQLVPEPAAALGGLAALATVFGLAWRRRIALQNN